MNGKRLKRKETSKVILHLDIAVAIIVTGTVIIGELTGHDMSSSTMVAGLWDAQLAVVVSFYLWKSKNENRSKHAMQLVKDLADKYGIDAATRVAEIVLKE